MDLSKPSTGEIILYQPDDTIKIEVRIEDEMVWINRLQMAELFDRDIKTIGKHINNALREELRGLSVVAKFATTAADGKTYNTGYYNLDMVLSVGYRVKSQRGVQFRIWANRVLKEYLLRGYTIHQRIDMVEKFAIQTEHRVTKIEKNFEFMSQYIEAILSDNNDINEDTRMQLENICEELAELKAANKFSLN